MHGDRVLGRIVRRRPDGRAEGRVVQIVTREHPTVVGLFRYGPHGNHVLPYDVRLHHEVLRSRRAMNSVPSCARSSAPRRNSRPPIAACAFPNSMAPS